MSASKASSSRLTNLPESVHAVHIITKNQNTRTISRREDLGDYMEETTRHHSAHSTHFKLALFDTFSTPEPESTSNNDADDVMAFLRSGRVVDEVYSDELKLRESSAPYDTDFVLPQVTAASVVNDGQDVVRYLNERRYTTDMEDKSDSYDVHMKGRAEHLEAAVNRLNIVSGHLQIN